MNEEQIKKDQVPGTLPEDEKGKKTRWRGKYGNIQM